MARGYGFTPAMKARAIRLYRDGATLQEAADGCNPRGHAPTREAVRLWIVGAGLSTRGRLGPARRLARERGMVLELGRQGLLGVTEIAASVGVNRGTAGHWLRRAGIHLGHVCKQRQGAATRRHIAELLERGMAPLEIADHLGIWYTVVYRHMRAMGLRSLVDRRTREYRRAA